MGDRLRERLVAGEALFGTFIKLAGIEVVDLVAAAGFDFAILDREHSHLDERAVLTQLSYAGARDLPLLVRVPDADRGPIGRYLEAGAAGIQLADVRSAAQARTLVSRCRFPPDGERGVSTTHRAAGYGRLPVPEYVARESGRPLLVAQVEADLAANALDELLATGIDVAFVGVVDMSVALGIPGKIDGPEVTERLTAVAAAARRAGVAFGHHLAGRLRPSSSAGYFTVGTDVTALGQGLATALSAVETG